MIGILIITVTALILGVVLVSIDTKKDTSDEEILKCLPGINCGGCGFGSCEGMVEAIKEDSDNYLKCRPLRGEELENMKKLLNKINNM